MQKVYEYSHLGGNEILRVRYPQIETEIDKVISSIGGICKTKKSKEKTMRGEMLYSPKELNEYYRVRFRELGYNELRE